MTLDEIARVEQKIDRLAGLCNRLQSENQSLRNKESGLLKERNKLLKNNEMARSKVENMISRLKALDNEG